MHNPFNSSAREAINLAEQEARAMRHDFVGTEHLLLGLLEEQSGIVGSIDEVRAVIGRSIRR